MDGSETYTHVKFTKTDSRSPTRAEPDVSYAEVNFKSPSVTRVRTDRDGLNSTYSELNFRKAEARIDQDENLPNSSGPGGSPNTAQTGPHNQEPMNNTGNRSNRKICLLCLVTFVLVAIVAGLSIYVSQIRQSEISFERNYQELNSTFQSKLSALNSDLSVLKRMHSDLRHQFTEMETKYRSVNETKAQISELLTSRRVQTCPQKWIKKKDRCYFISTLEKSYYGAKEHCSTFDARLLEINSNEEEEFVSISIGYGPGTYWIGKCRDGNVGSYLLYEMHDGLSTCRECNSPTYSCDRMHRFICGKPAHLYGYS